MKTLYIFLFLMLFSTSVFSQEITNLINSSITAKGLRVVNKTKCTQYFVVFGSIPCKCNDGGTYQSEIPLTIAPSSETYYDYQNLGGDFIFDDNEKGLAFARIVGHPMEKPCYTEGTVGQPCASMQSSYVYLARNAYCSYCEDDTEIALTTARWIPAQSCDQDATLLFTNP